MIKESAYKIKNFSTDAVMACIFGAGSLISILVAVGMSYIYEGRGPALVGLLGIGSFIMAFIGIVFAVSAWKSADGTIIMKRVAILLNAIPLLGAIVLFVVGIL